MTHAPNNEAASDWQLPTGEDVPHLLKFINSTPLVMSLLYDLNLLPECVQNDRQWAYMVTVCEHMQQALSASVAHPVHATWVGPTGKQVHGLVNRNPAPDAAAPALMSETTTILFGGGPVGYAREVAGAGSCATEQECEWQPWCRMHANCRKKIEAARTAKNNASAPDGGKSA
jgi:hypothetical protein